MATLADLPLGATILIPVGTEENRLCEIADKDNLVSGGTVLVYKKYTKLRSLEILQSTRTGRWTT